MKCPDCRGPFGVERTVRFSENTRRVRTCMSCGHRFLSLETIVAELKPRPRLMPSRKKRKL